MDITIKLEGDKDAFMNKLQRLQKVDLDGISASVAQGLRTSTLNRFRSQKGPNGKRWKTSIRASQEGGVTLSQTARLRNSISIKSNRSGAAIGTNTIYAATHQFGDSRTIRATSGKGLRFKIGDSWVTKKRVSIHIPARPFLGVDDSDIREIKETVEDAFRKA